MRVLCSLVLCSSVLSGCTGGQIFERTHEQRVTNPPAPVRVKVDNGSVSLLVTRSSMDADIRAIWSVRAHDQTEAEIKLQQCTLGVSTETNVLEIQPTMPDGVSVSLHLTVPDTQGVLVTTKNGSIDVSDAAGDAILTTDNGSIRCRNQDGIVSAKADNGSITVLNPTAEVEVISDNGSITITEALSYVRAKSNNGRIEITVQADMSPSVMAQTDNGSVSLTVGPAFEGELMLSSDNGSTHIEDPDKRVRVDARDGDQRHVVIGDSEDRSSLMSNNGSVTLTITSGPPPGDPAG